MQLLLLLKVGVELGETLQCELVGQPDELGVWHVLLLEVAYLNWVGRAEHENLFLGLHDFDDLLHNFSEVIRQ